MPRKRMSAKEARQTAQSLEGSLKSTAHGLDILLQSLERSGFKAAIAPYKQMQHVLLQQRLWSVRRNRRELDSLWKELADKAEAIHAILGPFSDIMANLKDLDRIHTASDVVPETNKPTAPPAKPQQEIAHPVKAQVIKLMLQDMGISGVRLVRNLDCAEQDRKAQLRALVASGAVVQRGWGRSRSYQLSSKVQQKLAADLTAFIEAHDNGANQNEQPNL